MTTEGADPGVALTVGQVAQRFGITVRSLHHYDEVGLLVPSGRTVAGYRVYSDADLRRLATVVVYRRLGFGLDEIGELLDGATPVVDHLRRQRAAVESRMAEMSELITALDHAIRREEEDDMSEQATPEELRELFGEGFDEEYAREAQERWGDTDAWTRSQARTAAYTAADWATVKEEADAINDAFTAAMAAGRPATSAVAVDAAEAARRHIDERFYACPPAMHRGLADMYLADPRFTATYERLRPGLARYVHDAIHANADRQEAAGG
jgi:MerR family transcriptional regulator, thiopeptide resistance regulator